MIKVAITSNINNPNHSVDFIEGEYGVFIEDYNISSFKPCKVTTKRINASWTEDSGNGGLPSNLTVEASTLYHGFKITKKDGTFDYGFDTDIKAKNLLAEAMGYIKAERAGSIFTDENGKIRRFTFDGFIPIIIDEN